MKLDLTPQKTSTYVTPTFGSDEAVHDPELQRRMRRPMVVGGAVIAVLVVGLGLWASLTPLASGLTAPAEVRVESNRKTIRHKDTGTVRQILVKEGQRVRAGQTLIVYDDVESRAAYDVFQNQYDTLATQAARLKAEATNRTTLEFPPEITSRMTDARVATMVRDQQFLFATRQQLFESQAGVLNQRLQQIDNQIEGDRAQVQSVDEQSRLTVDEMSGYQTLYEKGFAPRNLILRYQRTLADLAGRKGSLLADMARLSQQKGETRMQLTTLSDQRQSQAAEELRETESRLADMGSRLAAAKQALDATVVRSPVDGYVFNLTQFTVGGVTGSGEVLMEIVPADTPLIVTAMLKPTDIGEVKVGMDARVHLSGLGSRWNNAMPGKVVVVSADRIVNEKTGASGYRVDVRIDPKDLKALKRGTTLTPGEPVSVMVVTGKRTIMGFLISPITDTIHNALREQ